MTILTVHRKGTLIGACSRTCYNSHGDTCNCVCGGLNHGNGERQAVRQAPTVLRLIAKKYRAPEHKITLHVTLKQLCLFLLDTDRLSDSTPQET